MDAIEIASAFVTIRPQTDGFEAELAAAVGGSQTEVPLTADTSEVEGAIDDVTGDVEVGVDADTSDAEAAIDGIEATPAVVPVEADTAQAQASIDDLSGAVGGLSDSAGLGGGAIGGLTDELAGLVGVTGASAAGIGALVGGLVLSATAAGESQAVNAQLDQILRNAGDSAAVTGDHIRELATEIMEYSGISDEAVVSAASMVASFTNVSNSQPTFDRTLRASADLAVFMGTDVASAAKMLGRALNDPEQGVSRLARVFPSLTAAQKDAISSMAAAGDIAGAQALIFELVESKVGGLAATYGETMPGEIDKTKEALGELAEALGADLLPAISEGASGIAGYITKLTELQDAVNSFGGGAIGDLQEFLVRGAVQSIPVVGSLANAMTQGEDAAEGFGSVVGELPSALSGTAEATDAAAEATDAYAAAQEAAQQAVADTLPTLGGVISAVDRAGSAFGVLNASSDPQIVIDNLSLALVAWDDFQANISTVSQWGPNIAAALQQLGPEIAGGLTNALAEGNAATVVQLDGLIAEIQAKGGEGAAVLTGFAQNGMDGAVAAVQSSTGPMGAAGTAAGASGAAGIDAGLTFTNAAAIGAITGTQYGAGVASGISGMYATVNAVATNMIAGAGNLSSAYSRGQALGSAYGSGIVAGLAGQVGNAAATKASLDAIVERVGAGIGRGAVAIGAGRLQPVVLSLDGQVVAETVFDVDRRIANAEGYEQ